MDTNALQAARVEQARRARQMTEREVVDALAAGSNRFWRGGPLFKPETEREWADLALLLDVNEAWLRGEDAPMEREHQGFDVEVRDPQPVTAAAVAALAERHWTHVHRSLPKISEPLTDRPKFGRFEPADLTPYMEALDRHAKELAAMVQTEEGEGGDYEAEDAVDALRQASWTIPPVGTLGRPDPLPGLPEALDLLRELRAQGWDVVRAVAPSFFATPDGLWRWAPADEKVDDDREERLESLLADLQESMWGDLDDAMQSGAGGDVGLSIRAAGIADRLVDILKEVPPTEMQNVPWRLVTGGVYEDLTGVQSIEVEKFVAGKAGTVMAAYLHGDYSTKVRQELREISGHQIDEDF